MICGLLFWARYIIIERPTRIAICVIIWTMLSGCSLFGSGEKEVKDVAKNSISTTEEAGDLHINLEEIKRLAASTGNALVTTNKLSESTEIRLEMIDSVTEELEPTPETEKIKVEAQAAIIEQQQIQKEAAKGVGEQDQIQEEATVAKKHVETIDKNAKDTLLASTQLTGKESDWDRLVAFGSRFMYAIIAVVVFLVLLKSGAFKFLRMIPMAVGLLIPREDKKNASLDYKVLNPNDPTTIRESVAAKRESPYYNAAWKKAERDSI